MLDIVSEHSGTLHTYVGEENGGSRLDRGGYHGGRLAVGKSVSHGLVATC